MTKDCVEYRVVKRQPSAVSRDASDIIPPHRRCGATGGFYAVLVDIDADNLAVQNRLSQTQRNSRLAAPAIKDGHVGMKVWKEKASVDICAARLDRGVHLVSCRLAAHQMTIRSTSSRLTSSRRRS